MSANIDQDVKKTLDFFLTERQISQIYWLSRRIPIQLSVAMLSNFICMHVCSPIGCGCISGLACLISCLSLRPLGGEQGGGLMKVGKIAVLSVLPYTTL